MTHPPQTTETTTATPPARRKRRVFMWVFLAIQVLFLALVIIQLQGKTGASQSDLASSCYHHNWWPLFKSQQDCVVHFGGALNQAGEAGKGIGAALIIGLWVAVDVITGMTYGVYRLATRGRTTR
jgi:hypothetical protein